MQNTFVELERTQPVVMKQLQGAFEKERLAHAFLFEGPAGAGKGAVSEFFAKLLLCENPEQNVPCETCRSCRLYESGNHPGILRIRPDGQFIKIDQIRELIARMSRTGFTSGRKIYIIEEADRMNPSSANALLKFLEEPGLDVTAILLTDRLHSIVDTIRSRCQLVPFRPLPREGMVRKLKEQGMAPSIAATVSVLTQSMEEAAELAADEDFLQRRKTVLKLISALQADVHDALLMVQTDWLPLFKEKEDAERGLDMLLFAYRDIASAKAGLETVYTYPDMEETWKQMALQRSYAALSDSLQAILQAKQQLPRNMNRTLLMEQLMLNLQEG